MHLRHGMLAALENLFPYFSETNVNARPIGVKSEGGKRWMRLIVSNLR